MSPPSREINVLVAREDLSITRASCEAGTRITSPHVHHEHTDAFYVLEGQLTFELGPDAATVTVPAGELVAVPPNVVHSFRNAGDRPARWLTIHAPDCGFAAFVRGIETDWDVSSA
jgi:mannose-6-phosphate isomerase-like protein (cupin superfamily)